MTAATLNQSPVIVQTFMGAIYSNTYYAADTGSANAVVIPLSASPASYLAAVGTKWSTIAKATNTSSSMTAKIGSLGAVAVTLNDGVTLPAPGSYIAGQYYEFTPNAAGTGLILLNPSRATGSFTITLTGMNATVTGTVNYATGPDGKTVYVWVTADITGTSNTTSMTGTGVPPATSPATSKTVVCILEDTSTRAISNIQTGTATTWTFRLGASTLNTSFTASGTKGFNVCEFSFTLD